jgi:chemotaxis signal transduction protein
MTRSVALAQHTVEIVLFKMGGVTYAADASQVIRFDRAALNSTGDETVPPRAGRGSERALIVRAADGVCRPISVEAVAGLQTVAVTSLRRLPQLVGISGPAVGFWLDGETPVVLLDLLQLVEGPEGSNDGFGIQ